VSGKSYTLKARAPFTAEWRTSHYDELAGALLAAWRKHKREWAVGAVEKGQRVVLDREGLARAFDRMDELLGAPAKPAPSEAATQALREMADQWERREA
jgi:hypothetical protein